MVVLVVDNCPWASGLERPEEAFSSVLDASTWKYQDAALSRSSEGGALPLHCLLSGLGRSCAVR